MDGNIERPRDVRLSVCIPTYNRAAFLPALLDSIASQIETLNPSIKAAIEVVVTDNASVDDTSRVVDRYRACLPQLVYHRHATNIGADGNFLAAVEAASGEYCWLMGSDDIVEADGLQTVLRLLEDDRLCGMSVNRWARSFDLQDHIAEDAFPGIRQATLLKGPKETFERISHYLAYLSGQIVRRALWREVVAAKPVERYHNGYVHVYVIAEMLKRNPRWLVVPDRLVGWRSDNDSFMAAGRFRRLSIDVVGYEQIARGAFGADSATYRAMRDTVACEQVRHGIIAARIGGEWSGALRRDIVWLSLRYYWRSIKFWRRTAPLLFAPGFMFRAARILKRRSARSGHV